MSNLQQSRRIPGIPFFDRLRLNRGVRNAFTTAIIVVAPILVLLTLYFFGAFGEGGDRDRLQVTILIDIIYVLLVVALISRRIVKMIAARRRNDAGSSLHLRITALFTVIALIPTVLVAIFATLTLNFGLESWFSERVRNVVNNSLTAAQAYEDEHRDNLTSDSMLLSNYLNAQKRRTPLLSVGQLREFLESGQLQMQRALKEAYVIDSAGNLIARGEQSYRFDFEMPSDEELQRAMDGEIVIIEDWDNSEFRALVPMSAYVDRLLYVTRTVDGDILSLLDETRETVVFYNQLERERGKLLFEFALVYLGFALIVILAAVWFGMWFAERLSRPIGRLVRTAERVGQGDMSARVREMEGDDEIAILGRTFNTMLTQVGQQRDALISINEETERSRRLFDSVLSGVTAGVIGLNSDGRVEFVNTASAEMLSFGEDSVLGQPLIDVIPEFTDLFQRVTTRQRGVAQGEIEVMRAGQHENLLVRIASRKTDDDRIEGYVLTFDDVTDLVSAQRMAAWGDVARRIAHEIKNPLTPIQLSAERLKRKFSPLVGDEKEALEQLSGVIIRQTEDLRRIVDEFAKFARMPEPDRKDTDLGDLLKGIVMLQQEGNEAIRINFSMDKEPIRAFVDPTLMGQAFTNLIKNAAEAIQTRQQQTEQFEGEIRVSLTVADGSAVISIQDNGIGFPVQRNRLFEPYVTNRETGTGLGLSIVKKIIEDHDGKLDLIDAPVFEGMDHAGAEARIILPLTTANADRLENGGG